MISSKPQSSAAAAARLWFPHFHKSSQSWSLRTSLLRFQINSELRFPLQRWWSSIWIKWWSWICATGRKPNWQTCCFQHPLLDVSSWTCTSDCRERHQILRKSICGKLELKNLQSPYGLYESSKGAWLSVFVNWQNKLTWNLLSWCVSVMGIQEEHLMAACGGRGAGWPLQNDALGVQRDTSQSVSVNELCQKESRVVQVLHCSCLMVSRRTSTFWNPLRTLHDHSIWHLLRRKKNQLITWWKDQKHWPSVQ